MGFLDRLRPRREEFFEPLTAMASHAAENAVALKGLLATAPDNAGTLPDIRRNREQLDAVSLGLEQRLADTFIAPIDPEDLADLNNHLHDLGDAIDDAARMFVTYRLARADDAALAQCAMLVTGTERLREGTLGLRSTAVVRSAMEDIRVIEHKADDAYTHAMSALFRGSPDPIAVLKWKDVYSRLEDLVDMVRHTSDVLHRVSIRSF